MLVNKVNLSALYTNLKTEFNKAFTETEVQWKQTAMKIPSTGSENAYKWLSMFPQMREWLGDKKISALEAFSYTIVNKSYEATVGVDRDDIKDDNLGMYGMQASEYGMAAKEWPDTMIAALKNAAFSNLCYDGKAFYATNHPVGKSTFSNKGTVALSAATTAAAAASYGAGRIALMNFKSNEGRPLGLIADVLEVSPSDETTANLLMKSDKLTDESPNPYKGQCKVIVNPLLDSSTAWFMHVTRRRLKPFIFQQREKPSFVKNYNDEFMRKKYYYGVEARGNAGYGLPQLSYGSTGAA